MKQLKLDDKEVDLTQFKGKKVKIIGEDKVLVGILDWVGNNFVQITKDNNNVISIGFEFYPISEIKKIEESN